MAQQIRRSSTRRSMAFAAIPVIAALSVTCTSCAAPNAPASEEMAVAEATLPPVPESDAADSSASANPTVTVSASVGETPFPTDAGSEVAPLSSAGTSTTGPTTILPSASVSLDPVSAELAKAVADRDPQAAQAAVSKGADMEAKDSYGRSALMRAVINRDEATALRLLSLGANPNSSDDFQDTVFLRASGGGMIPVLRSCIEAGADLNATNRMGSTALSVASENGRVESVRVLLQHDVAVDHVNDLGWTALHGAIVLGHGSAEYVNVVHLLLLAGADPYIRDFTGNDAFELASEWGQTQVEQTLRTISR